MLTFCDLKPCIFLVLLVLAMLAGIWWLARRVR